MKIEISPADLVALRSRLSAVMERDEHAEGGSYLVRSLYFDSPGDRALREKTDGADRREKFRIRYYNGDTGSLRLEKKSKRNGLCGKQTEKLTEREVIDLINGGALPIPKDAPPLSLELRYKMKTEGLRPKVVVDYVREPFVYPPGNVRVTFDRGIRTALRCTDFLDPKLVTIPAGDAVLMEVKWDSFLPLLIRDAIQLPGRSVSAFSKYAQCRIYG